MSGSNYTHQHMQVGSSPSSSPLRPVTTNKRVFEDEYSSPPTFKKLQSHRIHSEVHTSTIQMMMNASKLHQYEACPETTQEDVSEEPSAPVQKPFWPQITRVKQ